MSTEVQSSSTTKTAPSGQLEQLAQGVGGTNLRELNRGLQFQSAMARAALGLPFDPSPYQGLTREELGLAPSRIAFDYDAQARDRILEEYRSGRRPLDGPVQISLREVSEEEDARAKFIEKQQSDYDMIAQNPLTQLTQQQIQQARDLQPIQQEAQLGQLRQNLALTNLARQRMDQFAPLETSALQQYLTNAQSSNQQAFDAENTLRGDLTDLVTSGRAASPEQQAKIDEVYRNRLKAYEEDIARQYEDTTRLLPEVAVARGLRVNSADLPDRYALARREYIRQGAQGALGFGAEAAQQSLNYPLQLGNLNVQQQYLTGQQQGRMPGAVGLTSASYQPPGYFGFDPNAAFGLPLNLMTAGMGGVASATSFQNPFLQSRLANTTQTGNTSTGGVIPALGASASLARGLGSLGAAAMGGPAGAAGAGSMNANGLPFAGKLGNANVYGDSFLFE